MRQQSIAEATVGHTTTARVKRSRKRNFLWAAVWLVSSGVFAYFQMIARGAVGVPEYILSLSVSLFLVPAIFGIIATSVGVLLGGVFVALSFAVASFGKRWERGPTTVVHTFLDFLIRTIGLAVVVALLKWTIQAGVESVIPYFVLLAAMAAFSGELVAMLLFLTRFRRVVARTNTLLEISGHQSAKELLRPAG